MAPSAAPFRAPTKTWHTAPYPSIDPTLPAHSAAGKVVVVSGGGSGIGPAIARAFAKAGAAHIVLIGRTPATLAASSKAIRDAFPNVHVTTATADVADAPAIDTVFQKVRKEVGPVDVLVSNAGYLADISNVANTPLKEWTSSINVNVLGAIAVSTAFLKVAAPGAVLVNVTTAVAHVPALPGYAPYAASKLAALKVFEYIQAEHPEITVVSVHPGTPVTQMYDKSAASGYDFPPDDIDLPANFIVWVASKDGAFLKNKVVWCNWDVDELKANTAAVESQQLTIGLFGWPF